MANDTSGLRIIDVTNPQNPTAAGHYDTPAFAMGVAVSGDYAYVADDHQGLRIINVSNPQSPYEAGYYDTPGVAEGVAVSGSLAYVADWETGLRIIEYYGTGVEEIEKSEVRRVKGGATIVRGVIQVDSRQNTAYRADLLDAMGRKVLTLMPGANDVGRLSPGVYFATEQSAFSSQHSGPTGVTKVIVTR